MASTAELVGGDPALQNCYLRAALMYARPPFRRAVNRSRIGLAFVQHVVDRVDDANWAQIRPKVIIRAPGRRGR